MKPVDDSAIREAARLLRGGGLVAFPTETVYGLGANAFDAVAVRRIFAAKGRPATSPLIVHVASATEAQGLASKWPKTAALLAAEFWPGPLTLVVPKRPNIPDEVTAGLPTVGLRMPDHPVALALIREAGVPVAAPSANLFTELSPTAAGHVRSELRAEVDFVLDGGESPVGIESTVVSLTGERPVLLRPGMVSIEELEDRVGEVLEAGEAAGAHPSPGMHHKHYSPGTRLVLCRDGEIPAAGRGVYLEWRTPAAASRVIRMPGGARSYAARLYGILHELDREGWDWIAVEEPLDTAVWAGIRDRLRRAAE